MTGMQSEEEADPRSVSAVKAHCVQPEDHRGTLLQYSAGNSSLYSGSDNLISVLLLKINSHNAC